jgi:hypothetical protein
MEPSIGMQGIIGFEFIGHFVHKGFALGKITKFRQIRKLAKAEHFICRRRGDESQISPLS